MTLANEIPTAVAAEDIPYVHLHRLTVAQYHDIIDAGILTADDRIELLEGILVEKMGKKPLHSRVTQLLRSRFEKLLPAGWHVIDQEPLTTAESEPEPDVMIVRGELTDYLDRHPSPPDVALLIEVSDTTLTQDRTLKLRIFALAGVPVYWIVNLTQKQIEVHTQPEIVDSVGMYRNRVVYREKQKVPVTLNGREIAHIALSDLIPE